MDSFKEGIKKIVIEHAGSLAPENIDKLANSLGKSLRSFLEDKQDKIIDMKDHYEGVIKERPLPSVATALAAGIIIGLLFRRS